MTPDLTGYWSGVLSTGGSELGLIFHLSRQTDGTYQATLDIPAQNAKDIPVDKVSCREGLVRLEATVIKAVFEGRLSADHTEIVGQVVQNGLTFPVTLRRTDQAMLRRPQEPQPPYPYKSEEVAYENKSAGVRLAGTLTMPMTGGPFPAVILITGSGQQDRDVTIFGHRPFMVLADYLTRRGLAVLRVDDRGIGGSTGDAASSTSADFAGDVRAGLAYLLSRKEIDARRIGLLGHSEGGLIAPMVAVQNKDVAFIVLMAGPGVPGDEILTLQAELIMRAGGANEATIAREIGLQRKLLDLVKTVKDDASLTKQAQAMLRDYLAKLSEEERKGIGDADAFIRGQVNALLSPWIRFFLAYDPRPTLRQVACPVLAITGEKDLQVDYRQNLPAIEAALKEGGNEDHKVMSLPGLNHLFQTCQTGSPAEYGAIEETMAPQALKVMGDWIMNHVGMQP